MLYLGGVLGDLADAGGSVLAHVQVRVPEALEYVGEDLGLDDHLCEIYGMLRDLPQAAAHLWSIGWLAVGTCLDDDSLTRRLLSLRSLTFMVSVSFEDDHLVFRVWQNNCSSFSCHAAKIAHSIKGESLPPSPKD